MSKKTKTALQITPQNILPAKNEALESLTAWIEAYFRFEVTTLESSQKEQRRDLKTFLEFVFQKNGDDRVGGWTPRLTQAFKAALQKETKANGTRRRSDRTVNRILATVKTFSKWVHRHRPFPLGDPNPKTQVAADCQPLGHRAGHYTGRAAPNSRCRRLADNHWRIVA
jgi:site-specific recombinase XerD